MILALTHGRDLEYQRIIDTIRSLNVPYLHEVGLRDRFVPEGDENASRPRSACGIRRSTAR